MWPKHRDAHAASNRIWWLDPGKFLAFITTPVFLLCALYSQEISDAYGFSNFVETGNTLLGLGALFAIGLGCHIGANLTPSPQHTAQFQEQRFRTAIRWLAVVSIIAHAVLIGGILVKFELVLAAMSGSLGAIYEVKSNMQKVEGITSFSQMYLFVYPLCAAYSAIFGRPLPRREKTLALILFFMVFVRAFVILERFAIIEAMCTFFIVICAYHEKYRRWSRILPFIGFAGVYILFAAGEYTRSWAYNEAHYASFFDFVNIRLLGYIEVAMNNGVGVLELVGPLYAPYFTMAWLRKLPIWENGYPWVDGNPMNAVFDGFGSAEFNNPCGIYSGILDFGWLSPVYYIGLGLLSGILYKLFIQRSAYGLIYFPGWFLGFVVLTQANYWGDPRFFLLTVLAPFVAAYIKRT